MAKSQRTFLVSGGAQGLPLGAIAQVTARQPNRRICILSKHSAGDSETIQGRCIWQLVGPLIRAASMYCTGAKV